MENTFSSVIAASLALGLLACAGADGSEADTLEHHGSVAAEQALERATPAAVDAEQELETIRLATPVRDPLAWRPCGEDARSVVECAELDVPVDYAEPNGERLSLSVRRIPFNAAGPRRGALLLSSDRPGVAGVNAALSAFQAAQRDAVAPGFDIIVFEASAVAQSGERGCELEAPAPLGDESSASLQERIDSYRTQVLECERQWQARRSELDGRNPAHDVEELRKALKEPELSFYGTADSTLGERYALEYPETTGRFIF